MGTQITAAFGTPEGDVDRLTALLDRFIARFSPSVQ
jgi:hypothetical protein